MEKTWDKRMGLIEVVERGRSFKWWDGLSFKHVAGYKHGLDVADRVVFVVATDDHISYISARFPTLPIPVGTNRVTWFGDTAKFIVENLIEMG